MASITINANIENSRILSLETGTVYSDARDGLAGLSVSSSIQIGQAFLTPNYSCNQVFLSFDTSVLTRNKRVTEVEFEMQGFLDSASDPFTHQARIFDWSSPLAGTAPPWQTGANLNSIPLAATFASSGFAAGSANVFTENGSVFSDNIDLAGTTRIVICSDENVGAGTAPTAVETQSFRDANSANPPKLTMTYEDRWEKLFLGNVF